MFTTYILYSKHSDRYYIGCTSNINDRIKEHNSGKSRSTKPFRPWILVYKEEFETRSEA
ncbi:MAG: GIY-YIG nuclease family protein [Candidatus Uhrbacteria bacterium]|nr:GIY-YIG nuclease family protein [Candidatus Uhrbacteria bacterium]